MALTSQDRNTNPAGLLSPCDENDILGNPSLPMETPLSGAGEAVASRQPPLTIYCCTAYRENSFTACKPCFHRAHSWCQKLVSNRRSQPIVSPHPNLYPPCYSQHPKVNESLESAMWSKKYTSKTLLHKHRSRKSL